MKKIYGFAALCAAMTLASCSNENEPNVVVDNSSLEPAFMKIAINTGTRAQNDDNATPEEIDVNSASFVVFNASGTAIGVSTDAEFDWKKGSDDITMYSGKTVQFKKLPNQFPAYVMAFLNYDVTGNVTLESTTVDDLRKIPIENNAYSTEDGFIMSNAAIAGSDHNKMYCAIIPENGYTDVADKVKDLPATNVYVERVCARVGYTAAEGFDSDAKKTVNDGENKTKQVSVEIQSIKLYKAVTNANLIKDMDGLALTYNDANGYRSHWAKNVDSRAFNDYYSLADCEGEALKLAATPKLIDYVMENVGDDDLTQVIITGKLKVDGADVDDDAPIYKLSDNNYYTTEGMKAFILSKLTSDGYGIKTTVEGGTKTGSLTEDNLDIKNFVKGAYSYDCYAQIKLQSGETLTRLGSDVTAEEGKTVVATVNEALAKDKNYRAYRYTNGLCYYHTTIDATTNSANQNAYKGIVRNHVYNIAINSIVGLGIPMFDPTNKLIPEDPEKLTEDDRPDYYINCSINVLNWAVFTQNGSFNTPGDE